MKFAYEYRTSDNVRHEGIIGAVDREAAFRALRVKGIRPGRLTEVPGFFNRLFGKGKRWITIGVLGALCLVLCALSLHYSRQAQGSGNAARFLTDTTRRQVIGDAAVIEKGILDGWSDVFESEGDRFLASFAIPGVKASVRNTSVEAIEACLGEGDGARRKAQGSSLEARQISAMVEGMKDELREFLADGGTVVEYGDRLVARQERELAIYNRARDEIARAKDAPELRDVWERCNDRLRRMGIRIVPWPE